MKRILFAAILMVSVLSACSAPQTAETRIPSASLLPPSPTYPPSPEGSGSFEYSSVAEALAALKSRDDVSIEVSQGWTIVTEADGLTTWSFTPPGHPAHPAVAKRVLYQEQGEWYIRMNVRCEAEQSACDQFVKDFEALNEQMRQYIEQQQEP